MQASSLGPSGSGRSPRGGLTCLGLRPILQGSPSPTAYESPEGRAIPPPFPSRPFPLPPGCHKPAGAHTTLPSLSSASSQSPTPLTHVGHGGRGHSQPTGGNAGCRAEPKLPEVRHVTARSRKRGQTLRCVSPASWSPVFCEPNQVPGNWGRCVRAAVGAQGTLLPRVALG